MPIDPGIALQTQSPNPTNLISSFIDLGQKKLNLDKSRETYDADVAGAKALSSSAQSKATVDAANVQPLIQQQAAQTDQSLTAAQRAHFTLSADQAGLARQIASGLAADPDVQAGTDTNAIIGKVAQARQMMIDSGIPQGTAESQAAMVIGAAHKDPASVQPLLKNMILAGQAPGSQSGTIAPSGVGVSNGQQSSVVNTNPFAGTVGSTIPGTSQQQQIPPTAPTMRGGQPGYVGPQAPAAPGAPPVPSGAAIGQTEATVGPIATNNQHFAQVQADAATAPTRVAALQTIKQEAGQAATGGGDYRRTFFSQLSGLFGLANDKQTATDVMAKNLAVLASQAGNTDASRALGEMANPSFHMTEAAAKKTADQLIGIEGKKTAAQSYFANTPTNSPLYQQKMDLWNKNADPRAFEYAQKSPAEQATMKAELQKAGTWNGLRQKMVQLHAMGVDPE